MSEYSNRIVKQTEALLHFQHDETLQETTPERLHEALGQVIMMEISDNWTKTKRRQAPGRRAFYFSAEYLVGRLVYSNLFNLGILREVKAAFAEKGVDLACLEQIEDAALGNGGLGRLAACFLDSAATLDLPLTGYGLRYRFGLFKQSFEHGRQRENADDWTKYGDPWSHRRDKLAVKVKFADQTVNCVPYDMPVIGYQTNTVGTLRLWQCEAEKELDFDAFNAQDYVKALEKKNKAEDITRVLYPNDSTWEGKRLRIKQQYVLSSASLQDILRDYREAHGTDYYRLPEFAAVQLNDTHPAMSIPELIRLLMAEGLDFDAAFEHRAPRIRLHQPHGHGRGAGKVGLELLRSVVPEICDIIERIDARLKQEHPHSQPLHRQGRAGAYGESVGLRVHCGQRRRGDPFADPEGRPVQGLVCRLSRALPEQDERHHAAPLARASPTRNCAVCIDSKIGSGFLKDLDRLARTERSAG